MSYYYFSLSTSASAVSLLPDSMNTSHHARPATSYSPVHMRANCSDYQYHYISRMKRRRSRQVRLDNTDNGRRQDRRREISDAQVERDVEAVAAQYDP